MLTQSDGYRLQGKLSLKSQVFHLGGNPWVIKTPFLCQQCLKENPSSSPTAALSAIYPSCGAGSRGRKQDSECGRLGQFPEGNPRAAVVPTENISPAGAGRGQVSSLRPEARGRSDQLFPCPSNSSQTSLLFPFPLPILFYPLP